MNTAIIRAALIFAVLLGDTAFAAAQIRTKQAEQMPVSFTWRSEYWPKGLRQWSQTAPDRWTEKYQDDTADRQFHVLRRLSMGGSCAGLHLKSMAEPLEAFIPGSRCSSKWLLFRWVSIFTSKPEWIGQAEIRDIQYAPAAATNTTPAR
jgi:hypothetical protein